MRKIFCDCWHLEAHRCQELTVEHIGQREDNAVLASIRQYIRQR